MVRYDEQETGRLVEIKILQEKDRESKQKESPLLARNSGSATFGLCNFVW